MKRQHPFEGPYLPVVETPPSVIQLLWALALALFILATVLWFVVGMWSWGGSFTQRDINMFYPGALINFVFSALIAAIPILAVNWSRTMRPRIALAVLLLIAQVVAGSLLILIPRSAG